MHGTRLPLMSDWSDALCEALDGVEPNLARAIGLTPGLDGPAFEAALGLVLQWRRLLPIAQRFVGISWDNAGHVPDFMPTSFGHQQRRLDEVVRVVNETLYANFGHESVSDAAAQDAYGRLLEALGAGVQLVVATTNYDLSAESALEGLGFSVKNGFAAPRGRTPVLAPDGLVGGEDQTIPVLHLHGAVGWYGSGGHIFEYPGDQPFNSTLGTPVVLYPDPEKDPTSDANVAALWIEFEKALALADRVLVIGHSLHDPVLARAVEGAGKPTAVTVWRREDEPLVPSQDDIEAVRGVLPRASVIGARFGPEPEFQPGTLETFIKKGTVPAAIG